MAEEPQHDCGAIIGLSPKDLVGVCFEVLKFSIQAATTRSRWDPGANLSYSMTHGCDAVTAIPPRVVAPVLARILQRYWDPGGT
jgi:hypothetical protein